MMSLSLFFKFRLILETVISLPLNWLRLAFKQTSTGFTTLDYFYKFGLRNVCILYNKSEIQTTNRMKQLFNE